jgi:glycosyltransferase involved in cell wall biosynthesis
MMEKKSIVFLYSELAGYFLSCITALNEQFGGKIYVVHWPINPEAPFEFDFPSGIELIEKSKVTNLVDYIDSCSPMTIVCSGWMDKEYLKVCKVFKKRCNTILTMDNHWTGSLKQRLACILSPLFLTNRFSHIWVPGEIQKKFATKLGFKKVLLDYYCSDIDLYTGYYHKHKKEKERLFPKRFVYVGRYVELKGVFEMWDAFIQAIGSNRDWELWCIGTGDQFSNKMEHPQIKHFGFVQPIKMEEYIKETSVFVLPSKFEPWGVVTQEYAAAGFPMIVSDKVGAIERYVQSDVNGFVFKAGDVESLRVAFENMMKINKEDYISMSRESYRLGTKFTPSNWADILLDVDVIS